MSESNLTAGDLETKILRKLNENTTGTPGTDRSEAFQSSDIFDAMNEIYEEVFNCGRDQKNVRKETYAFDLIADVYLDSDLDAGDTSIILTDSSKIPSSGRILIGNEFIDYTANDDLTTLTCDASAVSQDHSSGDKVKVLYALPSGIDKENYQYMNVNGIEYKPRDISELLNADAPNNKRYSIFDGYIVFPDNSGTDPVQFIYTPTITRATSADDIFSLIPNNFRVPLIVNGSVGKLKIQDMQSDAELYYRPSKNKRDKGGGLFYNALWRFYAMHGRQGSTRVNRKASSIYD